MKIAVIGVGHLGRHHARILSALPDVELVAIVDINQERAEQVAAANQTQVIRDAGELIGRVDGVVIATPTESHAAVARPFLEAGMAVLIEKPMARSMAEADELVRLAREGKAILAVGHTERFNPAVAAARPLLTSPRFIEVHRLGAFPDRSLDIDVVFDLMIHDLDVVLSIVSSPVAAIDAVGVPVLTPRIDIANVRLRFESGCIVNLTASRISRDRTRKIRFFQPESYVSIDYAAQEVEMWRLVRQPAGMPTIEGGPVAVTSDEPLKRELEDFVDAIRQHRLPTVTGDDGHRALALAQEITQRMILTTHPAS
jgi:predicted dehydrogenase